MRTSHLAIRKRIMDERMKITDEELFASSAFSAYLTDIAEAATRHYRRSIKVSSYWDTSEDAGIAATDNKYIRLNAGNRITRSFPTRGLRTESLLGIIGHEVGHILYSDFQMLALFNQTLASRRFYPEEPENLTPRMAKNLIAIKECFAYDDSAAKKAVCMVAKNILNILEDIYIEARMCDRFPGKFKTGILLNDLRFSETMPSIQEQIEKDYDDISILINLLLQYARHGDVNNLGDYKGKFLDALYECVAIIDDAVYDDDARVRFRAANHILLILWSHMQTLVEKIKEDEKNGTNLSDAISEEIESGSGMPDRTGKSAQGIGKYEHQEHESSNDLEEIQKTLEGEDRRIELKKTDEIGEGENGGITFNRNFAGSGYTSTAASDMNRILTQIASDQVYAGYEDHLTEELKKEADRIRYGNAHKGVHINVNRMTYVDRETMENYQKVAPPLLLLSKRMQKQVAPLLKDKREGGKLDGLPIGRRINARHAIRNDGCIFYKRNLPEEKPKLSVALLIDESGSMSSSDRITHARSAAIVLYDFCKSLDIPVIVYGHTEYSDVEMYAYAEFSSIDGKDMYRLMDMSARSGNRDGAALRYVAERLLTRDEDIKLLILISDGQPAAAQYYGTEAEADLRGIKKEYKNKGITMFAAAIGDDRPNIERIYGEGFLDITVLNKLPANLAKLIAKYIKATI